MAVGCSGPIGIIVVNYGSHQLIAENLGSESLSGSQAQIIIVDNYSSTVERGAVREMVRKHGWTLVELADNRGFGAAVNIGVDKAAAMGCVTFLLLNPDASISEPVIQELRTHSQRSPMELLAPRLVTSGGSPYFQGSRFDLTSGRIRGYKAGNRAEPPISVTRQGADDDGHMQDWLTGACLVVSRPLWEAMGGFDEAFFLYWEDVDFSYRCAKFGATLTVRRDLVAIHDEGGTQGRAGRAKSDTYYYYNCRNRLLFATRHFSRLRIIRWLVLTPRESWRIVMRGGRRQFLQSLSPLRSSMLGTIAGVQLAVSHVIRRRPTAVGTSGGSSRKWDPVRGPTQ